MGTLYTGAADVAGGQAERIFSNLVFGTNERLFDPVDMTVDFVMGAGGHLLQRGASALINRIRGNSPRVNPCGNCFPAGTLVGTQYGLRPIETIEANDLVWAFDHADGEWRLRHVVETFTRELDGELIQVTVAGDLTEITHHHPFWVIAGEDLEDRPLPDESVEPPVSSAVPGRWVDACYLREGDVLLLRDGRWAPVTRIALRQTREQVYNFQVEELQCYAVGANQALVHNSSGPCDAPKGPATSEIPPVIYREGGPSPSNLTPRPQDAGRLSFRDSLSNPIQPGTPGPLGGQRPVLRPGQDYIAIDTSKLPPESVIPDGVPGSLTTPPGHVSVVNVPPDVLKAAVIPKPPKPPYGPGASGKFPK